LQTTVNQVVQSEFSRDGRVILTLEQDNQSKRRSMHVWYNQSTSILSDNQLDREKLFIPKDGPIGIPYNLA
jgi:hypothetical protein